MLHQITRVRHDLRRRRLAVCRREQVTPNMLRLVLTGDDLINFDSPAADDHVKLFVANGEGIEIGRNYTPRRYDLGAGELTIDFALHDAGPATNWARNAQPGDVAEIGGPRGSVIVPDDFDWWLLVGDETALPAIGRRIEEFGPGRRAISVVTVTGQQEIQTFNTAAEHLAVWVERPAERADDPALLLDALRALTLPTGEGFIWIAAEANVARVVRNFALEELEHFPQWMRASGYWIKGSAGADEKFES
ncbi:siderophore-interacting protein [Novosphingobium resinovorum]|uniref:siderophore-interacting protein n=1 Tax=Novosphingobium resinovorum TaxID=158500 RepID=UPI002ED117FF|nr:siderophore-interacting protein [Novosphingobium resinovorum]